jgi:tRNA (cytidine32/guanosine34-2'-O)-methyltransferase
MSPLPGVVQIQGDITEMSTAMEIISHFDGELARLVVCDGAPDVTGHWIFLACPSTFHVRIACLRRVPSKPARFFGIKSKLRAFILKIPLQAFNITSYILAKGGTFVSKVHIIVYFLILTTICWAQIFRAKNVSLIYSQMKCFFKEVHCSKPKSSRQSSCEAFIVCKDFQPPDDFRPDLANPVLAKNYGLYANSLYSPRLTPHPHIKQSVLAHLMAQMQSWHHS